MKSFIRSMLLLFAAPILLAGCKSVPITTPGADVPAEYAAFSGTWEGTWGKNLYGQLAVQTVSPTGLATGWYSWGNLPGSFNGGAVPFEGEISDGVLKLATFSNGANVSYRLIDERTLEGRYSLKGKVSTGRFIKQ